MTILRPKGISTVCSAMCRKLALLIVLTGSLMLCIVCENHEENAGNSEFKRRKNLLSGSEFPWSQQQVLTYGNEEKGVVKDRILDKPSICPNYTGKLSI